MEANSSKELSRGYRFFLYIIILSSEGVCNLFAGILSSASKFVKQDLELSDKQFGSLNISNGIGRVLGCLLFSYFNTRMSRRILLFLYIFFNGISCSLFTLTNDLTILIVIRGIIGLSQMAPSIYVVNYIDQFGLREYKNAQMSSVQFVQAAGKSFAYLVHILVGLKNWKKGFHVQCIYMMFCSVIIIFSHEDYFSRTLYSKKESGLNAVTLFEEQPDEVIANSKDVGNSSSYFSDLCKMSKNKMFLMGLISRCVLFGLNTGLHFWFADYMRSALGVDNAKFIFMCYTIICLTGPAGGTIANLVFKKLIGDYRTKRASYSLIILHTISCFFGIGISLMPNVPLFVLSTIGYFIFNSCSLPLLQGILVNSIEKRLSVVAFSFANLLTQVVTSGPAPFLYGAINDKYKTLYPSLAMFCLMFIMFLALPFLIILAYLRNKIIDKANKDEKLIEKGVKGEKELEDKQ